jgi:hypothetical protein
MLFVVISTYIACKANHSRSHEAPHVTRMVRSEEYDLRIKQMSTSTSGYDHNKFIKSER